MITTVMTKVQTLGAKLCAKNIFNNNLMLKGVGLEVAQSAETKSIHASMQEMIIT